jgi:MinD-like ATPase involved in chromosome partitioning or flagellar assembly
MRLRLVTVGVGAGWESSLVQACQVGAVPAVVMQRCYDLADLVAVAAAGRAEVVLVAATMRWLDREAVTTLRAAGLAIVGVIPPGDEDAERRLHQIGVDQVAHGSASAASLVEFARIALAIRAHRRDARGGSDRDVHQGHASGGRVPADGQPPGHRPSNADCRPPSGRGGTARHAVSESGSMHDRGGPAAGSNELEEEGEDDPVGEYGERLGELVAVWGPKGAPGRTTVAVNLAFEALPYVGETLLVDADTYGGSISQMLGFLDDHPSLAWAARLATRGELDGPRLLSATNRAGPAGPRVLPGLPRAELWTELRPSTWHALLDLFMVSLDLTIIDVGFCLEEEEELAHDHVRFRRNAVSRIALQRAHHVIAVARADPVGLHDFIRGYQQLRDLGVEPGRIHVLANQARPGVFGGDAVTQIRAELARYLGVEPSALIPYDRGAVDAATSAGKALREVRRGSPAQQALAAIAAELVGAEPVSSKRQRMRRRRRRERRRAVVWNGRPSGPTMTSRNLGW